MFTRLREGNTQRISLKEELLATQGYSPLYHKKKQSLKNGSAFFVI